MSSAAPDISVVIVNYNSTELLYRCLDSLRRQTYTDFEVLVVDNASESIPDPDKMPPLNLTLLRQASNLGFAAANNLGINAARGDWVACLNPDAFVEPAWLQTLVKARAHNHEISFFGSCLLNADDTDLLDGTGDVYHVSGLAWRRDHGRSRSRVTRHGGEIFAPCAAAALYRKSALVEVGGFDESYFCYFEDVDLGFRLRLKGHRCWYVPEARVLHLGSAITGYRSDFSLYHGHRNMIWTYFKNMPTFMFWIFLPQHLLMNFIAIVRYGLIGQGPVVLKAKWHGLKGIFERREQRRSVQSGRKISSWQLYRSMSKGILTPYIKR
ncbi:MAG: glycosyltransferase family 2 protein [Gammaproteobacteria bacterium]|nr:glycosyltransferase family 2 protein [Gammaproteobacteria bacterium]